MSPATYTKKDIDELIRTLRGYDGVPGVMERLATVETMLSNIEKWVEFQKNRPVENVNDALVSWAWVRDKIVQPSFMLFVGWFLFSFLPAQLAK